MNTNDEICYRPGVKTENLPPPRLAPADSGRHWNLSPTPRLYLMVVFNVIENFRNQIQNMTMAM